MIEFLVDWFARQFAEIADFFQTNYDPIWDTLDVAAVFLALYWLLLLIRGTRAVQIVLGLIALSAVRLFAEFANLATLSWILDTFLAYAPLMIVVLFQADIRRALARVGRGFFPRLAAQQETQTVEEIVQSARALSERRLGALIVLERETGLDDLIEIGQSLDAAVRKELLVALFHTTSPLHDGAVVVSEGRVAHAGCILPLTLRTDLPEGVGTRHRAAVGITEESDAVVVVVSEETGGISVVNGGALSQDLDPPALRSFLTGLLTRVRTVEDAEGESDEDGDAKEGDPSSADPAASDGDGDEVDEERAEDETERTADVVKLR